MKKFNSALLVFIILLTACATGAPAAEAAITEIAEISAPNGSQTAGGNDGSGGEE